MDSKNTYFLGESGFSIYVAFGEFLDATGEWKRESKKARMHRCDLVLGDRFDIPYHLLREGNQRMLINYFKGSHRLTLKASMARTLRDIPGYEKWMPVTFVLDGGKEGKEGRPNELPQMLEYISAREASGASPSTWIVKPSAGCKGQGVMISTNAEEMEQFVKSNGGMYVAQQYIERPFLINGRKFDIRVWALLAPPYDIYIFQQGSCRTASVKYDLSDLGSVHGHLTNHCLQESSVDFGKYEEGNEMWYEQLDAYFKQKGMNDVTVSSHIEPQMSKIIVDSLLSIKELIEVSPTERYSCFQLFGYDFILDEALQVHLLEINGSPGSADKWLPDVINGMHRLCVNAVFPPATTPSAEAAVPDVDAASAAPASTPAKIANWEKIYPTGNAKE